MNRAIHLRWRSGEPKGYTDVLLLDQFANEQEESELVHDVIGPRDGVYQARYLLTVAGSTARLNYEAFPDFNTGNGMLLGLMRLSFSDARRTRVRSVVWCHKGDLTASPADVVIDYRQWRDPGASPPLVGTATTSLRRNRLAAAAFQRMVARAYRYRCALSGCPIPGVLEAAHIDPYDGPASNRRSNGILLRRDLHALFDRGQLAFHPRSLLCHFAPDVLHWAEYKQLHRAARLARPQPAADCPDIAALERRWDAFRRASRS